MERREIEAKIQANEARLKVLGEQDMYCYSDHRWPALLPEAAQLEKEQDRLCDLLEAV